MTSERERVNDRLEDLRKRAHRIAKVAREDDDVPPSRVRELEGALELIELGWRTVGSHPDPVAAAPYDLLAALDRWESEFDERERELGIDGPPRGDSS